MKRKNIIIMMVMIIICCVGCSKSAEGDSESGTQSDKPVAESSVKLLSAVWDQYEESEKFPVIGGDFSEENNNPEGPGAYALSDAEAMENVLLFPASKIDRITDAASLVHMMNSNTFTCGTFRVKGGVQAKEIVDLLVESVEKKQWICGFPDKYVIYSIGQDVVLVLGTEDLVDTFCEKFEHIYPEAVQNVDEDINM